MSSQEEEEKQQGAVQGGASTVLSAVDEVNSNVVDVSSRLGSLEQSVEQALQQRSQSSSPETRLDDWESKWRVSTRLFPGRGESASHAVQRAQQHGAPASFVQMPALLEAAVAQLLGARALVIKGLSGKGKTHMMASLERWLRLGGPQASAGPCVVTASHYCSAADGEWLDAWNVLWSLVGQLGDRSMAFRAQLVGDLQLQADLGLQFQQDQLVAKATDCRKAYLALAGALARAHAKNEEEDDVGDAKPAKPEGREKVVILVDGLDEAWERGREVVECLADLIGDFRLKAARVAFVFSSRPLPSLLQALGARLNAAHHSLAELDMDSDGLLPSYKQALQLHVTHRLQPLLNAEQGREESGKAYLADLLAACGGLETPNFLHADLVLGALERGDIKLTDLQLVPHTGSIADKVHFFLQRQFSEPQRRQALVPLLELLVAAPAHLPRRTLLTALWLDGRWLGRGGGGRDWEALERKLDSQLRELASFIAGSGPPSAFPSSQRSRKRGRGAQNPSSATSLVVSKPPHPPSDTIASSHKPAAKRPTSLESGTHPDAGAGQSALLSSRLAGGAGGGGRPGEGRVGFHYLVVKESLKEQPFVGTDGLAVLDLPRGHRRLAGAWLQLHKRYAEGGKLADRCLAPLLRLTSEVEVADLRERRGKVPRAGRRRRGGGEKDVSRQQACQLLASVLCGSPDQLADALEGQRNWLRAALEGLPACELVCSPGLGRVAQTLAKFASHDFRVWEGKEPAKGEEEEEDARFCSADIVRLVESVTSSGSLRTAKLLCAAVQGGDVDVVHWVLAKAQTEGGAIGTTRSSMRDEDSEEDSEEEEEKAQGFEIDGSLIASSLNARDPHTAAAVVAELLPLAGGGWQEGSPLVESLRLIAASSQPLDKVQLVLEGFLKRRPLLRTPAMLRGQANNQLLFACQGAAGGRSEALLEWLSRRERKGRGNERWVELLRGTIEAEESSQAGYLDGLPMDLLKVVFGFLNGDSWRRWCAMAGTLQLSYCHKITDAGLASLSSLTGLQTLNLSACGNITGGGLASLSSLTGLQTLNLIGCRNITDAGLASLSSLTGLQTLNLRYCDRITGAGLTSLSSLTGLQTLNLSNCDKITGAGLASLSSLTGLQTLNLSNCDKITGAGLTSLSSLTGLQTLDLSRCVKITGAGLTSLSSLTGLQTLDLSDCDNIMGAGLTSLSSLTGLQTLDLNRCVKITGSGLASLSSLTGLQTLNLIGCRNITDTGLASLSSLTGLQTLDLWYCDKITGGGLASLSSLTGLQTLNLSACGNITDAGLASLSSLTGLQTLALSRDKITGGGLASLSSLTGLQTLDLRYCDRITGAGLTSLSSLTGLQTLNLSDCDKITGAGLTSLSSLTGLQTLDLSLCRNITDPGFTSLSSLTGLQTLNLRYCNKITYAGLASFSSSVNIIRGFLF